MHRWPFGHCVHALEWTITLARSPYEEKAEGIWDRRGEGDVKMEADDGGMWPQAKEAEDCWSPGGRGRKDLPTAPEAVRCAHASISGF